MAGADSTVLPTYADTVVVGGGTAGAAIAARLAERSDQSVLLLEAGPDYGPRAAGRWPRALLDPRSMPVDLHSWGYVSSSRYGAPGLALERARVIGGCSSHNACAAVWGHRLDYDGWAALGNPGWEMDALLPLFHEANRKLRVSIPRPEELTPWHQACLEAGPGAGFPFRVNMNDVDLTHGIATSPINVAEGTRWNTAFGYLDPVRARPNLTIRGEVLADRLVLRSGRAVGVDVVGPGGAARVEAERVVVSCGAYGSPLLLQRSGIGDPADLGPLGIETLHPLPGVGKNLQEHVVILLLYPGTAELTAAMAAFEAAGGDMREDALNVLARSSYAEGGVFDLHLYPMITRAAGSWAGDRFKGQHTWLIGIGPGVLTPRSRGSVTATGRDPEARPRIDHAYFSDPEDRDLAVLLDGVELSRALAAQPPLDRLLGPALAPAADLGRVALADYIRANSSHAYHPVGSCMMGPASDRLAVVDARGAVHGLEGLYVADASIMPRVPRANTNLPTLVAAEKIAALLLERAG